MKHLNKVLGLAALMVLSVGCSDDLQENFRLVNLKILEADMPEAFMLNETYTIFVTYERMNGCVYFEGFDVHEPELTTREIVAIGTELEEADCTEAITQAQASFNFNVLHEGTYTFRFFSGFDENNQATYLEYSVAVEE